MWHLKQKINKTTWDRTAENKNNFKVLKNLPYLEKSILLPIIIKNNTLHFSELCVKEKQLKQLKSLQELRLLCENSKESTIRICSFCLKIENIISSTKLYKSLLKVMPFAVPDTAKLGDRRFDAANTLADYLSKIISVCSSILEKDTLYEREQELITKSSLSTETTVSTAAINTLFHQTGLLKTQSISLEKIKQERIFYDLLSEEETAYLELVSQKNKDLSNSLKEFLCSEVVEKNLEKEFNVLSKVHSYEMDVLYGRVCHYDSWPNDVPTGLIKNQENDELLKSYWRILHAKLSTTITKKAVNSGYSFAVCIPLTAAKEISTYFAYLRKLGLTGADTKLNYLHLGEKPSREVLETAFSLWETNSFSIHEYEQMLKAAFFLIK